MAITDSIKDILSVKIKPRHDAYSDQFSRIFLVKVMLIAALLIGLNWYSDKITCIIPGALGISGDFVTAACWINGLYVYEAIRYHADELGYYGLPRDINMDGMYSNGELCATTDAAHTRNVQCKPLEKTFFLQYQYFTFVMAALALLYYSPYGLFRLFNQDMVSLKGSIEEGKSESIVKTYFNYEINTQNKMRLRILANIIIKILYIVVNVGGFIIVDSVLNGRFASYGMAWVEWSKLDNTMAYDYMGQRHYPKPGNALIPSFAFCEVQETAQDIKTTIVNRHRFVCELSQHILYQYVLVIVWFVMVFGIIIAVFGLLMLLVDHIVTMTCFQKAGPAGRKIYEKLSLRECEYLEYIRRKNMPLYNDVVNKLKEYRFGNGLEECQECLDDAIQLLNMDPTKAHVSN